MNGNSRVGRRKIGLARFGRCRNGCSKNCLSRNGPPRNDYSRIDHLRKGRSMNGSYRRLARRVLVIRELVGYSRNCQKMFGSSTKKTFQECSCDGEYLRRLVVRKLVVRGKFIYKNDHTSSKEGSEYGLGLRF